MIKPNYHGGSIVNLMSTIQKALGGRPRYPTQNNLKPSELNSKNVILLVIDGLGYDYIKKHGKNTILGKNLRAKMTSVFPSTTAAAIPTFLTGEPAQQHALTGWYMHLKELGTHTIPLPSVPRTGGKSFSELGFDPRKVFDQKTFFEKIKTKSYFLLPDKITTSDFTTAYSKKAKVIGYNTLNGLFTQTKKILKSNNRKKFIYIYWSQIDHLTHEHGKKSKKVLTHFKELDKKITSFAKTLKDTTLIITSDHGQIDANPKKVIWMRKHPKLKETLTLPLCGEPRVAYCYVHPSKTKQFEKYVKTRLKHACTLHKTQDLIDKKYFGLYKPHKSLFDRAGDYTLIMKENYIIRDFLITQPKEVYDKGNHGGVSTEEMEVPLIVIK